MIEFVDYRENLSIEIQLEYFGQRIYLKDEVSLELPDEPFQEEHLMEVFR